MHMEHNTIVSFGAEVSDGNGFSSLGTIPSTQFNAVLRNSQQGYSKSKKQYEAWTSDGPGIILFYVLYLF